MKRKTFSIEYNEIECIDDGELMLIIIDRKHYKKNGNSVAWKVLRTKLFQLKNFFRTNEFSVSVLCTRPVFNVHSSDRHISNMFECSILSDMFTSDAETTPFLYSCCGFRMLETRIKPIQWTTIIIIDTGIKYKVYSVTLTSYIIAIRSKLS